VSDIAADFKYEVKPDRTLVIDDAQTAGSLSKGGNRGRLERINIEVPNICSVTSQDWRTIDLVNETMAVEQSVNTSPPGVTPSPAGRQLPRRHREPAAQDSRLDIDQTNVKERTPHECGVLV